MAVIQRRQQSGSALVVVLMIFALAFALSVEVVYRQHHAQTRAANLLEWDARYQMAIAAETLAIQGLTDDLEDDAKNNELVDDCTKEKWSGPFTFPYEDVVISASVQDLQGRFNINSLVNLDNTTGEYVRDNDAVAAFSALLGSIMPANFASRATALSNQMADWVDSDFLVNGSDGAEDPDYRLYRTANHPVLNESEFRSMLGFDAALAAEIAKQQAAVNKQANQAVAQPAAGQSAAAPSAAQPVPFPLWQYITALPSDARLNVNTAPQVVLEAVFTPYGAQAAAAQIVADRVGTPYINVADVLALTPFTSLTADQRTALEGALSVSTEYFQAEIDIGSESGVSRLVTRIKRPDGAAAQVYSRAVIPVLGALEQACNPD